MTLRLVVIAVFAAASAVPGLIAYSAGIFPSSARSADATGVAGAEFRVTSLAWPTQSLGLGATADLIAWEQRDRSKPVAGLWAYDVQTQKTYHLLGQHSAGRGGGFPVVSGSTVVWAAWPGRRGAGTPTIEGYDDATMRRWTVAERGQKPAASGATIVWIARGAGKTPGDDAVGGVDTVTDETFSLPVKGRLHEIAAGNRWASWVSRRGDRTRVWTASLREGSPRRLSAKGTAVAMDRKRVVWAAPRGTDTTAIVAWNRKSGKTTELCRVKGVAAQLNVNRRAVVWMTTGKNGDGDIWTYDFKRGRAYEVSSHAGKQTSPVLAGTTVFWADRRSGQWELYGRALQP